MVGQEGKVPKWPQIPGHGQWGLEADTKADQRKPQSGVLTQSHLCILKAFFKLADLKF